MNILNLTLEPQLDLYLSDLMDDATTNPVLIGMIAVLIGPAPSIPEGITLETIR